VTSSSTGHRKRSSAFVGQPAKQAALQRGDLTGLISNGGIGVGTKSRAILRRGRPVELLVEITAFDNDHAANVPPAVARRLGDYRVAEELILVEHPVG
jgi:hypothetical protein